jgi:AbrB family looped-hinge helix DNA binding protein
MQTSVTTRGQTVVPADIRKRYNIQKGDRLIWLEDDTGIRVIPVPKDPIAALKGRGKGEVLTSKLLAERQRDREREG